MKPFWMIECLDREQAELLLEVSPPGSHIEVVPKHSGDLVILWVPFPQRANVEHGLVSR